MAENSRSPKPETRGPKEGRGPKSEARNPRPSAVRASAFGFRPSFDLRPSTFDLRPSTFDLRPSDSTCLDASLCRHAVDSSPSPTGRAGVRGNGAYAVATEPETLQTRYQCLAALDILVRGSRVIGNTRTRSLLCPHSCRTLKTAVGTTDFTDNTDKEGIALPGACQRPVSAAQPGGAGNPKAERRPKQIRSALGLGFLRISVLGLLSVFEFRASDFKDPLSFRKGSEQREDGAAGQGRIRELLVLGRSAGLLAGLPRPVYRSGRSGLRSSVIADLSRLLALFVRCKPAICRRSAKDSRLRPQARERRE